MKPFGDKILSREEEAEVKGGLRQLQEEYVCVVEVAGGGKCGNGEPQYEVTGTYGSQSNCLANCAGRCVEKSKLDFKNNSGSGSTSGNTIKP